MLDTYTFGDLRAAVHDRQLSHLRHSEPAPKDVEACRAYLRGLGRDLLVRGMTAHVIDEGLGFAPRTYPERDARDRFYLAPTRFDVCGVPCAHASRQIAIEAMAQWFATQWRDVLLVRKSHESEWVEYHDGTLQADPERWADPGWADVDIESSRSDELALMMNCWKWALRFHARIEEEDRVDVSVVLELVAQYWRDRSPEQRMVSSLSENVDVYRCALTRATFMRSTPIEEAHHA